MPDVKYIELSEQLERELRLGHFGEWLPNVRDLSRQFGVAKATMSRALRPLAERGLIAPSPGGTRITELARKREGVRVVVVVVDEDDTSIRQDELLQTLRRAAQEDNTELVFLSTTGQAIFRQFKFWDASFCDGFIFVYSTIYQ